MKEIIMIDAFDSLNDAALVVVPTSLSAQAEVQDCNYWIVDRLKVCILAGLYFGYQDPIVIESTSEGAVTMA